MKTTSVARVFPGLLVGAVAGAAGTTTLNVITYLDIAVRGRSTSTTPERTVEAMARLLHLTVPGSGDVLANRISGIGALTGYAAGIGMGLILGLAYALGWRPRLLVGSLVAMALALVGTNGPMTVLGVTDPRTWGVVGWISDLIPHFGYGLVTALVLHSGPRAEWGEGAQRPVYRIRIEGEPDISCDMTASLVDPKASGSVKESGAGATVSTAMRVVNAIPYVVEAKPGMLSALDLPLTLPRNVLR